MGNLLVFFQHTFGIHLTTYAFATITHDLKISVFAMRDFFMSIFNSVDSSGCGAYQESMLYMPSVAGLAPHGNSRISLAHPACTPHVQSAVCLPGSLNAAWMSCYCLWSAEVVPKHSGIKIARFWFCLYQYSLKQRRESLTNQSVGIFIAYAGRKREVECQNELRRPRCCCANSAVILSPVCLPQLKFWKSHVLSALFCRSWSLCFLSDPVF